MENVVKEIELDEGFDFLIEGNKIIVKGNGKELMRNIVVNRKIKIEKNENKIKIYSVGKFTRRESAMIGTIYSHIKNMIDGIKKPFVYKMEVCYAHFPPTIKLEKNNLLIKNFLGEKIDRKAEIMPGVELNIKGNIIELVSSDIDALGKTVANIERATKIRNRDRRVFQDGIFLIERKGVQI